MSREAEFWVEYHAPANLELDRRIFAIAGTPKSGNGFYEPFHFVLPVEKAKAACAQLSKLDGVLGLMGIPYYEIRHTKKEAL